MELEVIGILVLAVLTGLFAGYISGLLGVGGGVILVPASIIILNVDFHEAKALSLFVIMCTSFIGMLRHREHGNLHGRTGLYLGVPGIMGSLIGVYVAANTETNILKFLFSLVLFYTAVRMIGGKKKINGDGKKSGERENESGTRENESGTRENEREEKLILNGKISGENEGKFDERENERYEREEKLILNGKTSGENEDKFDERENERYEREEKLTLNGKISGENDIESDKRENRNYERMNEIEKRVYNSFEKESKIPEKGKKSIETEKINDEKGKKTEPFRENKRLLPLVGFAGGFTAGLLGVGGGIIMVPSMVMLHYPMHSAVATSLMVIVLNSTSSSAAHFYSGELSWYAIPITISSLLTVRKGADMSVSINRERLRKYFGYFMIVIGIYMLLKSEIWEFFSNQLFW